MACAPSKDSDQPGHPPSLIRVFTGAHWVAKDLSFLHEDSEGSDQTGRLFCTTAVYEKLVKKNGDYFFKFFVTHIDLEHHKSTKSHVQQAKAQISLHIYSV